MIGRPKVPLVLTTPEQQALDSLAHRARTAPQVARRARIVLACARGLDNQTVAKKLHDCQGRSKIRPPWRRKTRPLGSGVEWRNAAVRRGRQDAGVAAGWRAFLLCSRR